MMKLLIKPILPIFLLAITIFACNGFSQSVKEKKPEEIAKSFFDYVERGQLKEGFNYITSTNKYFSDAAGQVDQLHNNYQEATKGFGNFSGYELLDKGFAGNSLVHLSYLIKYERTPLRLSLTFYKPDEKWVLYDLQYDSDILEELKESTSVYRLQENVNYEQE